MVACEQGSLFGEKIGKKGKGKGFSLSLVPRSTKGLFTGYWNGSVSLAMVVRLVIQL